MTDVALRAPSPAPDDAPGPTGADAPTVDAPAADAPATEPPTSEAPGTGARPADASTADPSPTGAPTADAPAPRAGAPTPAVAAARPPVRVRGLTVRAGGRHVLHAVDLDLPPGEVTALLGPEGSGKTTLLRVLLGLEGRRQGEVDVLGHDPGRDAVTVRRLVGFVPEHPALYESMNALTLGRFVADLYPTWDARRYLDHLARLGVPPRRRVADLTRSQAARLALAAALGHAPRLLVVDVPHDLDALGRHELLAGVEDDAAASGRTVLVATSRPHEVARLARHVVVLAGGQVRFAGAAHDLLARCRRVEVAAAAEPPPLPEGVRPLRWRPRTARRPGELVVLADDEARLAALGDVAPAHPVTLEEAYLALVE